MNQRPENKRFREGFVAEESQEPDDSGKPEALPALQESAPPVEAWPIVVKLLRKPVRNGKNELVHELSFREPTGGDINRYGNPVRIDQNGEVILDERKMTMIMSTLSGTLMPFLEAMDPRDWNSCAYRLRGFFLPEPEAWV